MYEHIHTEIQIDPYKYTYMHIYIHTRILTYIHTLHTYIGECIAYRRVGRGGEYLVRTRRVDIERLSRMAEIRRARPTRKAAENYTYIHTV
jgi:hypothetical protein